MNAPHQAELLPLDTVLAPFLDAPAGLSMIEATRSARDTGGRPWVVRLKDGERLPGSLRSYAVEAAFDMTGARRRLFAPKEAQLIQRSIWSPSHSSAGTRRWSVAAIDGARSGMGRGRPAGRVWCVNRALSSMRRPDALSNAATQPLTFMHEQPHFRNRHSPGDRAAKRFLAPLARDVIELLTGLIPGLMEVDLGLVVDPPRSAHQRAAAALKPPVAGLARAVPSEVPR